MMRYPLILALLLALTGTAVSAQTDDALPGSTCPVPDATTDVVICPERAVTNDGRSFVETQVFVRDARYGWLRLTPCEDILTPCDRLYLEGAIDTSESIEVSVDDPGDGEAQG